MFETSSWVDPGRAHGGAGDVLLAPEDRPGSGSPLRLSSERPRAQADVVRLACARARARACARSL